MKLGIIAMIAFVIMTYLFYSSKVVVEQTRESSPRSVYTED